MAAPRKQQKQVKVVKAKGPVKKSLKRVSTLKKTRDTYPIATTNYLNKWLEEHVFDPYPTDEEKKTMVKVCHLTDKKIDNWFTNARRRQWIGMIVARGGNPDDYRRKRPHKSPKPAATAAVPYVCDVNLLANVAIMDKEQQAFASSTGNRLLQFCNVADMFNMAYPD